MPFISKLLAPFVSGALLLLISCDGFALEKKGQAKFSPLGCFVGLVKEYETAKEIHREGSGSCSYSHSSPGKPKTQEDGDVVIEAVFKKGTGTATEIVSVPHGCGIFGPCHKGDKVTFHYSCDGDPWAKMAAGKPFQCKLVGCAPGGPTCNRVKSFIDYSSKWAKVPISSLLKVKDQIWVTASDFYIDQPKNGASFDLEAADAIKVSGRVSRWVKDALPNEKVEIRARRTDWGEDAGIPINAQFQPTKSASSFALLSGSLPNLKQYKSGSWIVSMCFVDAYPYDQRICTQAITIHLKPYVANMSDQPKNYKVDSNQPLPPLSPPPSSGGGGGGGKENMMAPPPVLSAPAAGVSAPRSPVPQGQPAVPAMAPTMAPASADTGRMAPTAGVPGCTPIAGATGQYACATREAHAGCERLRVAGAAGIRACTAGSEGGRR